jgi:hypothetical protein
MAHCRNYGNFTLPYLRKTRGQARAATTAPAIGEPTTGTACGNCTTCEQTVPPVATGPVDNRPTNLVSWLQGDTRKHEHTPDNTDVGSVPINTEVGSMPYNTGVGSVLGVTMVKVNTQSCGRQVCTCP